VFSEGAEAYPPGAAAAAATTTTPGVESLAVVTAARGAVAKAVDLAAAANAAAAAAADAVDNKKPADEVEKLLLAEVAAWKDLVNSATKAFDALVAAASSTDVPDADRTALEKQAKLWGAAKDAAVTAAEAADKLRAAPTDDAQKAAAADARDKARAAAEDAAAAGESPEQTAARRVAADAKGAFAGAAAAGAATAAAIADAAISDDDRRARVAEEQKAWQKASEYAAKASEAAANAAGAAGTPESAKPGLKAASEAWAKARDLAKSAADAAATAAAAYDAGDDPTATLDALTAARKAAGTALPLAGSDASRPAIFAVASCKSDSDKRRMLLTGSCACGSLDKGGGLRSFQYTDAKGFPCSRYEGEYGDSEVCTQITCIVDASCGSALAQAVCTMMD
jgi:hypothetical protein